MAYRKHALFSPAINSQQAMPSAEDEKQIFEDKFGQMAYQAFSGKFPDLVPEIVTFKMLDSDTEMGTGVGAFIIEQEGSYIYIPVVLSENELKPFDLMYVKDQDIFLPLNNDWLEEVNKSTISSMGDGAKLPDTVATDVDIRNLMVPPTTGRYSYASDVSARSWLEASSTEPLGRKLTKIAIGPFPGTGAGATGQPSEFNPEIWATFVEQFQRTQQMSPGQALDNNALDVDTLAKMYKSHTKTWEMMQDPNAATAAAQQGMAPAGAQQQQMPQQGMAPQQGAAPAAPQPGMTTTASISMPHINPETVRTLGQMVDEGVSNAVRGGLTGAGTGLMTSDWEDWRDAPGVAARGGLGGALAGPIGAIIGRQGAIQSGGGISPGLGQAAGRYTGAALGGIMNTREKEVDPYTGQQQPGFVGTALSALANPMSAMSRYASYEDGITAMLKHAQKSNTYAPKLVEFLEKAPNQVKEGFAKVLDANPRLLKKAAELYGEQQLIKALTHKTAGVSHTGGALYIADKATRAKEYTELFGEAAPEAFNGVLMRGYYFKDTRPSLNLAVQVQKYQHFQDTLSSGPYRLYTTKGAPTGALVITEPFDLLSEDRFTFPKEDSRVKRLQNKVPKTTYNKEPESLYGFDCNGRDIERSHKYSRLAILEDGNYVMTNQLMGEQVSENFLKGSGVYKAVLTEGTAKPSKGTGAFISKRGAQYHGTKPVEITELSVGTDGVVRGKISNEGGWGAKAFVMDPRSPGNRPMKLRDQNLVVIPASWKWVSLKDDKPAEDFLRTADALSHIVLDALGSMGVHEAVVRDAGESMYSVDGDRTDTKKEAIFKIASRYKVHASAAEAMLKIASHTGVCRSYIVTPSAYQSLKYRIKIAQGEAAPQTPMGGPPAMQQPAPAAPAPQAAPPAMPPAMQQAPAPAPSPPSAVDQAFSESMQSLQEQMTALQAQLDVLTTVQQRAQEIETGQPAEPAAPADPAQGGMPAPAPADPAQAPAPAMPQDPSQMGGDPGMQGMPEGMDPAMGMDPNADPNAQQEPQYPIMRTEQPSSEEIASQINPAFLEGAAGMHETGAFDAGTIASLARNGTLKGLTSQYASNLESSIDDLGRTLLTLYMQESQIKEQLGETTYIELETQMRDTFQGLGKLVLSMTHNSTMLDPNAIA
jgi:hypothetical protein